MMPPAASDRHLSKFEKTAENAASDCRGLNFSAATFCLPPPIGGHVAELYHSYITFFPKPTQLLGDAVARGSVLVSL